MRDHGLKANVGVCLGVQAFLSAWDAEVEASQASVSTASKFWASASPKAQDTATGSWALGFALMCLGKAWQVRF